METGDHSRIVYLAEPDRGTYGTTTNFTPLLRALAIEGWMDPQELAWLAFEAARHRVIVEVGSYLGRSTRVLGDNTSGVVYAVDHWNGPKEVEPPYPREALYGMFHANVRDLIQARRVIPVVSDSVQAAADWQDERPDMVFIDASHDEGAVDADIRAWAKVLKPGGLLCGHDAQWPGVAAARHNLLPEHMTGIGRIWAVDDFQGLKVS